ncbi:hypothetical protein ABPG75_007224 [Micractinium tetrahymenae]
MGQTAAKPVLHRQQQPEEQEAQPSGLAPRSSFARGACNRRRVRRLIRAGRLAACWMPLDEGQGFECPVCMELYTKLNHTACCHQDICTECFISIVAPGCGASARCPYCQAPALQVYLPPPGCACLAAAPAEAGAPSSRAEATAAAGSAGEALLQPAAEGEEPRILLRIDSGDDVSSAAPSTQASGPITDVLVVGAVSSGCPSAAAAAAKAAAVAALTGPACQLPKPNAPSSSGAGGAGSSAAPAPAPAPELPPAAVLISSPAADAVAPVNDVTADDAAVDEAAAISLSSGPALLLNPDGTEQLVLLSSGRPEADSGPGSQGASTQAAVQQHQQQQQEGVPSYQAPSNPEDDRMRAAIAQADAALLRQRQAGAAARASGSRRGGDWLEQMRQADAALRAAVARNDQQRFGGGAGGRSEDASS